MKRLALPTFHMSAPLRELAIFSAFLALTVLMTWPWARDIRDAVPDPGDAYLNTWIMWWDYHQTFRDPLNLFEAPIFFPYHDTLAFSEHNYGIALLFFPLYALGVRPLTVQGVATLVGFALSGYGAFRLTRTLTGSYGAAWVAGIAFGFSPYRFCQLGHLNYLFAGWIPLVLEALVLFMRKRSWGRAAWLGAAFFMNALTVVHWFLLTLIPLAVTAIYLLTRQRLWRERQLWLRGGVCLLVAALMLLPFLLPYRRVSKNYGMVRDAEETRRYSATPGNWLTAEGSNWFWRGFGPWADAGERALFPGMLPYLLLLAAFFLARKDDVAGEADDVNDARQRRLVGLLDAVAVLSLLVAALAYGYSDGIRLFGLKFLKVKEPAVPLMLCVAVIIARLSIAYPRRLLPAGDRNLIETIRSARCPEALGVGLIWAILGFFGSLGLKFFFHRFLFEHVFLFRSSRVPARWGMLGHLGIAVLAGLGAMCLAHRLARRRPRLRKAFVYTTLCALLLFELRSAPLKLVRGEADPDALTLRLKETPMRGGIVHLPAGGEVGNYRYVLRQTDHERPLVTAVSGFAMPIVTEVETLSREQPVPDRFLDLLEEIPASYLAVHTSLFTPDTRHAIDNLLARGIADRRLRYVGSFEGTGLNGNDGAELYAVVATEPDAQGTEPPPRLAPRELGRAVGEEPSLLLSEFEHWSYPLYRFYKAAYGRAPRRDEFMTDARATGEGVILYARDWQAQLDANLGTLAERFVERDEFRELYAGADDEEYVSRLFANAGVAPDEAERGWLVSILRAGVETRAAVLLKVVSNGNFVQREQNRALVLMHYFGYLRRNPDDPPDANLDGFNYWLKELENSGNRHRLTLAFTLSAEYQGKLGGGKR